MKTLILFALLSAGSVSAQDIKIDMFSHTGMNDSIRAVLLKRPIVLRSVSAQDTMPIFPIKQYAGLFMACGVNHSDGISCRFIDGKWVHPGPVEIIKWVHLAPVEIGIGSWHYPSIDSTWCPVYEHIFECKFKTGPWIRKHGSYYRVRICKFHKIKQIQRAK